MKGYKTIIFGLLVTLLPLLDYINSSDIFTQFISDPQKAKLATVAVGAMVVFLRSITTTPVFKKDE